MKGGDETISAYELNDVKDESSIVPIPLEEKDKEVHYFDKLESQQYTTSVENEGFPGSGTRRGFRPGPFFRNFVDSFKRAETTPAVADLENDLSTAVSPHLSKHLSKYADDTESREIVVNKEELKRDIKQRHVILMAIGSGVGTGLLVGNATTLATAGPAGLLIGYGIVGTVVYCVIQSAGEMAVAYANLIGGFNAYPTLLISPAFGFAVGWVYTLQWLCMTPLELVTASLTIKFWTTRIDPDCFVIIFYVMVISINLFGSKGYAEADFVFNCFKLAMITGFFILGIVITAGGAGHDGYLGAKYWHHPGAFRGSKAVEHFKGISSVFVSAIFAFGGSEFVALSASEQANPRRSIPTAAKLILYRILWVFLASIAVLGFIIPYTDPSLIPHNGEKFSPYVMAVRNHGVRVCPSLINAVILMSVLSVSNSAFFYSCRLLLSLAQRGCAPKWFDYVDRNGRPLRAMLVSSIFAVICFCATSPKETDVFAWLLAISGLSTIFTWFSICMSHIRMRRAMKVQGKSLGELGFKAQTGTWGSWYACLLLILSLLAEFWVALAPIGEGGKLDAESFFENYLAAPIGLALWFGYMVIKKDFRFFIRAQHIDLDYKRQVFDEEVMKQEDEEYAEQMKRRPRWRRVLAILFI